MKMFAFLLQFQWCVFLGSSLQLVSVDLGYGLAQNRQPAITGTNADPIRRRIYAAVGEMS